MRLRVILLVVGLLGARLLAGVKPEGLPADLLPPAKAPAKLAELSNTGNALVQAGKYKEAEAILKQALELEPKDGFCYRTLGLVYFSEGKYEGARAELTRALAIEPKDSTTHNILGICASTQGHNDVAQQELEKAIAQDANYADAHYNLAVVLATKVPPDKEGARKHYQRAVELSIERDTALENLIGIAGEGAPP